MPIYEYHCINCGNIYEDLVFSLESSEISKCPRCNGESHKIISAGYFVMPTINTKGQWVGNANSEMKKMYKRNK